MILKKIKHDERLRWPFLKFSLILRALMKSFPVIFFFDTSINRKIIIYISYHLIKHFQIKKNEVPLIKNVNNVNEATGMNTKQEQQQYSKWMRFQLMQSY